MKRVLVAIHWAAPLLLPLRVSAGENRPNIVPTVRDDLSYGDVQSLNRQRGKIKTPGLDPVEFDRACHDEAWGCAYSRVWRAHQEVIRQAA
jgi:hypothetical protein